MNIIKKQNFYLPCLLLGLILSSCGWESKYVGSESPKDKEPDDVPGTGVVEVPDQNGDDDKKPVEEPSFCQDTSNAVLGFANEIEVTIPEEKQGSRFSDTEMAINVRGRGSRFGKSRCFSLDRQKTD